MERKTDLIRQKFDTWAPDWDSFGEPKPEILAFLLQQIPQGHYEKILDLGCGTGVMSGPLKETFGGEVLGLDLSSEMIKIAKQKYQGQEGISFQAGDFYEFEGTGFDLILIHNAYPHFLDVDALCNKANDVLKEGGILAVMHSIGRQELNHHHEDSAMPISFLLASPQEEGARFAEKFAFVDGAETNSYYYFILKAKR